MGKEKCLGRSDEAGAAEGEYIILIVPVLGLTGYYLGNNELLAADNSYHVIFQGGRSRKLQETPLKLHDGVPGSELQRSNMPCSILLMAFRVAIKLGVIKASQATIVHKFLKHPNTSKPLAAQPIAPRQTPFYAAVLSRSPCYDIAVVKSSRAAQNFVATTSQRSCTSFRPFSRASMAVVPSSR